jgi:CRISPR/Cas system-associated exonuclease Cas4 (RecB family)
MDPVQKLYKHLDKLNLERAGGTKRPSSRFRPSEISQCARRVWYRQGGGQMPAEEGFLRLYGMDGNICHDTVRLLLRDAGVELAGLKFNDDGSVEELDFFRDTITHKGETFQVSGRGDGRIKVDDTWMYLEIKSLDAYKAKWLNIRYQEGEIREYLYKKYPNFVQQCTLCAKHLGLPASYLILKDRSSCQIGFADQEWERRGYVLPVDEDLYTQMLDKMAMITRMRREGVPPIREYTEGSKECKNCPFSEECYG